ncbi:MAG TPA: hypothetical protein PKY56_10165 [Candidatus Kapabacteria bacterium]|nr:hypothetical protein [Candidatus Kapabacteria bacterium]HPO63288.1 hypothetical protein [Candidatus Kapabacteria bacterium]
MSPQMEMRGQARFDTLVAIKIGDVKLINFDSLQFALKLRRQSDKWMSFANGTFQLKFSDGLEVNPDNMSIELISSGIDLQIQPQTGWVLPNEGYYVTPRIFQDRISITVLGPAFFNDTYITPRDSTIKIGNFLLTTKDKSPLSMNLSWVTPLEYYQAIAYKLQRDSMLTEFIPYAVRDDNLEIQEYKSDTVLFEVEMPSQCFNLKDFKAIYLGTKLTEISWETTCEYNNKGFILRRGVVPFGFSPTPLVTYSDTIATYKTNAELIGLGTKDYGKKYVVYDSVEYRGDTYCYLLESENFFQVIRYWDTTCVPIPYAVITKAWIDKNPFEISTNVFYELDDKVKIDAMVYDVNGKEVKQLLNKEIKEKGKHSVEFRAPEFASQGLYQIILTAYPIDDERFEVSRAYIKAQLVR